LPRRAARAPSGICNSGAAVRSITTMKGTYVDKLVNAWCGICQASGCSAIASQFAVNAGGDGGHRCDLTCPDNQAIYAVEIRYGWWIDAVRAYCRHP
jgi:hypothetical protein